MAIITYKTSRSIEALTLAAGERIIGTTVEHWGKCPHNTNPEYHTAEKVVALHADCGESCHLGLSIASHEGLVVDTYERNGYDDSDFYAVVVNPETLETKDVMYGTTRGWTYNNGADIDAPEELLKRWRVKVSADREASRIAQLKAEKDAQSILPTKGKSVVVVSRRSKVAEGTTGQVVWFGISSYANVRRSPSTAADTLAMLDKYRVGIKVGDAVQYLSASCVKVVD